jgi:hypothetical protein
MLRQISRCEGLERELASTETLKAMCGVLETKLQEAEQELVLMADTVDQERVTTELRSNLSALLFFSVFLSALLLSFPPFPFLIQCLAIKNVFSLLSVSQLRKQLAANKGALFLSEQERKRATKV